MAINYSAPLVIALSNPTHILVRYHRGGLIRTGIIQGSFADCARYQLRNGIRAHTMIIPL
jgi:hypothetical protein